jgi:hypothetical protein
MERLVVVEHYQLDHSTNHRAVKQVLVDVLTKRGPRALYRAAAYEDVVAINTNILSS